MGVGASLDSLVCPGSADGGRPDLLWGRRLGHRRLQLEKMEQILHTGCFIPSVNYQHQVFSAVLVIKVLLGWMDARLTIWNALITLKIFRVGPLISSYDLQ